MLRFEPMEEFYCYEYVRFGNERKAVPVKMKTAYSVSGTGIEWEDFMVVCKHAATNRWRVCVKAGTNYGALAPGFLSHLASTTRAKAIENSHDYLSIRSTRDVCIGIIQINKRISELQEVK